MVRDAAGYGAEPSPELDVVLDALEDADCRTILTALEEPMTASEIADSTDVPLSTAYRKLDLLSEASLLAERTRIRSDGRHATQYAVAFESVCVTLTDQRELDCQIERVPESPDERLATLWSELQRET